MNPLWVNFVLIVYLSVAYMSLAGHTPAEPFINSRGFVQAMEVCLSHTAGQA